MITQNRHNQVASIEPERVKVQNLSQVSLQTVQKSEQCFFRPKIKDNILKVTVAFKR